MVPETIFDVLTPLGFRVHCTKEYWIFLINEKHPILKGHELDIQKVLEDPSEVRRSRKDASVYLFYRGQEPRWLCAVAKNEVGEGFLVTAYPTDKIKMGATVWTKSK